MPPSHIRLYLLAAALLFASLVIGAWLATTEPVMAPMAPPASYVRPPSAIQPGMR